VCGKGLKNFAFVVDRTPQGVGLCVYPNEHFIEMQRQFEYDRWTTRRFLISQANIGPSRFH
jgi:hypothetical protein